MPASIANQIPASEPNQLPKTQDQQVIEEMKKTVDETKKIMVDNIDQLLDRGTKLEQLTDKSEQIEDQAQAFSQNARQMYIKARFESIAMGGALIGMILGAILALSSGLGLPVVAVGAGIGGALGYSLVWMFSGAIQSIMKLPIFNVGGAESTQGIAPRPHRLRQPITLPERAKPLLFSSQDLESMAKANLRSQDNDLRDVASTSGFKQSARCA